MKRTCKKVDIASLELITQAVYDCFRHGKKRRRADTRHLFARHLGVTVKLARVALHERNDLYHEGVHRIAVWLQGCILRRELKLPRFRQEMRVDPSSRKRRKISILGIRQLLFDHIAVLGMQDLARRIGEYQVSSIRGRGAAYGKRAIERWLAKSANKYAVKMDIRDFYGSVKRSVLMAWLHRRVRNDALLWLIGELVNSAPEGMAIGSYLSQTLANVYLSDLYHLAMEECRSKRGARQVTHALFYMDDMLLVGTNKRQLRYAAFRLMERAGELGLQIKPNWQVHRITRQHPVDMMGFRFSHGLTTLRKRVFRAARRMLIRAQRACRAGRRWMSPRRARRIASYHGYTCAVACRGFLQRVAAELSFNIAFNSTHYAEN